MLTLTYRDLSTKVLGNLADRTMELINQSAVDAAINNPLTVELKSRSVERHFSFFHTHFSVIILNSFIGYIPTSLWMFPAHIVEKVTIPKIYLVHIRYLHTSLWMFPSHIGDIITPS